MPKIVNLKTSKTVAVALAVLLYCGSVAGQNPGHGWGTVPVQIRVQGPTGPVDHTVNVKCRVYDSQYAAFSWNGVNTRKSGLPITNFVTAGITFPIPQNITNVNFDVTQAQVNTRFDPMHPQTAGWSKNGVPSMTQNCHGYSTGIGGWLNEFGKIMWDDYLHRNTAKHWVAGSVGHSGVDHSFRMDARERRIVNGEEEFAVFKYSHKINASAIYRREISPPDQVFHGC